MKIFITLIILLTNLAQADSIDMDKFDQVKLTEYLGRLSRSIRVKTIDKMAPDQGMTIENVFPQDSKYPFSFKCKGTYFNRSPYVSAAQCSLTLDETSPLFQKSKDEIKIVITEPEMVNGMRDAIPEGRLLKEFRSYGKRLGYTLAGEWAWIFDYYFSCSSKECVLKFSLKK